MNKIGLMGVVAAAAFSAFAPGQAAAQGRTYAIDGYADNCRFGLGGEGIISVGNGTFTITETRFTRQSELTMLGDGWVEAIYATMSEGEMGDPERVRVRATDSSVEIQTAGGERFAGARCR